MPVSRFVYDPWELPPEQRQATFVGREQILDRLLMAVREQQGRATVQHYILTGPRGIGKTTLLLMLRDRIRQDPEMSARWFCVQLREEEYYIHKQRDLWQLVLQALAAGEKLAEAQKVADLAQEALDEEKSSALLVDGLRSICSGHGKRLLLLIDNFDHIFPNTAAGEGKHRKPDSEYRAFRKRLSTEAFLMTIATSVRVFQDMYVYDKGFFHFFSPIELPELSQEEAVAMLRRLGRADDNAKFLARLERSMANLQTLWILTGGNPRLITMLYHILSQGEIGEPVQALWETVAGLTPMLRQELADMPRQQSKTLDALLRLNGAAGPAEISRTSRLPLNVVTTQLGRLKEARYVTLEGGGKGKKATYRIADQMFSVWYCMRYVPVARRRIELFIDFLRAWFSLEERRRLFRERWERFQTCQAGGIAGVAGRALRDAEYYAASLDDPAERLREMARIAEAYMTVGDWPSAAGLFAEIVGTKARSMAKFESLGYSVLASRLMGQGDAERAIRGYSEALARDLENTEARVNLGVCLLQSARHAEARKELDQALRSPRLGGALRSMALISRGAARGDLGDPHGALSDCTAIVELPGAQAEILALALLYRGFIKGQLGDPQGEIADYTAVVQLEGAPVERMADALLDRGQTRDEMGDHQGAISDYTAVLRLKGAPAQHVADALVKRGAARYRLRDSKAAIADYDAAIKLKGVPPEVVARALGNRALAKGQLGDTRGEIADCTRAAEVEGAQEEDVAQALVNRGAAKGRRGDWSGAIADSNAVLELKGAAPEQLAMGLVNRGVSKGELGDLQSEIADYTAVVQLKGAPGEIVAKALAFRGATHSDLGQYQEAADDFSRSLESPGLPEELRTQATFSRAVAQERLGKARGALADYAQCAHSGNAAHVHDGFQSIVRLLVSEKRIEEALAWVRRFHELEPPGVSLNARLQARFRIILMASELASLKEASRLVDALLETDPEELRARLRFLKPGLELARTNDESVLANLPEEERKMAREIARSLTEAAHPTTAEPPPTPGSR
jgi:tetratricopeptide (TPR) repeat protein